MRKIVNLWYVEYLASGDTRHLLIEAEDLLEVHHNMKNWIEAYDLIGVEIKSVNRRQIDTQTPWLVKE